MRRTTRYTTHLLAGLVAVTLTGALLAGCDSFLEKEPLGELSTESFFQDEDDAVAATNATYSVLRSFSVHVFAWLGATDIASDHTTKGSTPSDASFLLAFDNLEWQASNQAFSGLWAGYYQGIYRANVAIQNIPGIDMNEERRARLVGENKFLRAYYYFFLIRAFGDREANRGVPLVTEPLEPGEFQQPRASFEEVYNLIEQDLQDAIEALPEQSEYPSSELGRATKGAARAFLAKAHLFQEDYPNALQYAQDVIDSGEYSLHPDYSFIFSVDGEFSSGSIFEVGHIELEEGGGSSRYAQVQGVRGFPSLGWGFNQPSDHLETLYEPGDPRQQATILYPGETVEEGSDVVVHINPNMTNQQYNEKVQVPLSTTNPGQNPVNIRRMRYADVLLIAAEAAAETGDEATARTYLNQVRERARGDRTATLGIVPEQLNERLATNNLGLGSGTSRVFARYINDGGPAESAGLQSTESAYLDGPEIPALITNMDIIQSVNGTAVASVEEYLTAMASVNAGQTVPVEVLRVTQETDGNGGATTDTESLTVNVTATELLPDVTASGSALLEAIYEERGSELAMEHHRWFDIVHQGRAQEIMESTGLDWQDRFRMYPIPQQEIDLTGIQQNEGY
ncbi:MAG: RagB/SusD family nutrient uptake outer membrane protein [Bacteroidetes bacterium]|jgi:hypothetical protein|nr:RagB/SusD family nutrient uptake outer membrane protein [Bacteroidota bacterium]